MVLSVRYEEPGSLATLAEHVSHKWGRPGRGHSGAALASAHVAADLGGGCCRARKYAPGRRQLHLHHSTHRERLTWLEGQLEFPLFSAQIVSGWVRRLTGYWIAHERTRPDATVRPELHATRSGSSVHLPTTAYIQPRDVPGVRWMLSVDLVASCETLLWSSSQRSMSDFELPAGWRPLPPRPG
jgi:hypothetical protein